MALSFSGDGTLSGVDIAASGLGKVLQVVRATDSTNRSTTSGTVSDAGISVTITPKQSTSAIILIWAAQFAHSGSSDFAQFRITDAANNTISGTGGYVGSSTTNEVSIVGALFAYATPATTSPVTYKGRFNVASSGTASILNANQAGQMYAIEVAA